MCHLEYCYNLVVFLTPIYMYAVSTAVMTSRKEFVFCRRRCNKFTAFIWQLLVCMCIPVYVYAHTHEHTVCLQCVCVCMLVCYVVLSSLDPTQTALP